MLPYCADDAAIVFHDLISPDVAAGLDFMAEQGWNTQMFNTMQVLGVAWRGDVDIPIHHPDPNVPRLFLKHLEPYNTDQT